MIGTTLPSARGTPAEIEAEQIRALNLVKDDILKQATIRMIARDARGIDFMGQKFNPGVMQTASELVDLATEIKEASRAVFRHVDKAMSENMELFLLHATRKAYEETLNAIGVKTLDPIWALDDTFPPDFELKSRLRNSYLGQDKRQLDGILACLLYTSPSPRDS